MRACESASSVYWVIKAFRKVTKACTRWNCMRWVPWLNERIALSAPAPSPCYTAVAQPSKSEFWTQSSNCNPVGIGRATNPALVIIGEFGRQWGDERIPSRSILGSLFSLTVLNRLCLWHKSSMLFSRAPYSSPLHLAVVERTISNQDRCLLQEQCHMQFSK